MQATSKKKLKNCPRWLLDADTEDEQVSINKYGEIHWHEGTWHEGTWLRGTWHEGTWRGGDWCGGDWRGGDWLGGTWRGGDWREGTWRGGDWLGGTWREGIWLGGTWHGGDWHRGTWRGGTWRGGTCIGSRCKWIIYKSSGGDIINIGCKSKTQAEWDAWFSSDEEFETERNTEQFELIRKSYELMKSIYNAEINQ